MDLCKQIAIYMDLCDVSKELQMWKTKYFKNQTSLWVVCSWDFQTFQI